MTTTPPNHALPDLRSFLPSVVRTVVPLAVGYITGWPIAGALGLEEAEITPLVTVIIVAVYYIVVRLIETYVLPKAGWLLGWGSAPVYVPPADAGVADTPAGDVARVLRKSGPVG